MDQRDVGHDAVFFTRVQHTVIEGQTRRIDDMVVFGKIRDQLIEKRKVF